MAADALAPCIGRISAAVVWQCRINKPLSSKRKDFNYLHRHRVETWYKMNIFFISYNEFYAKRVNAIKSIILVYVSWISYSTLEKLLKMLSVFLLLSLLIALYSCQDFVPEGVLKWYGLCVFMHNVLLLYWMGGVGWRDGMGWGGEGVGVGSLCLDLINSLAPARCGSNFKSLNVIGWILEHVLLNFSQMIFHRTPLMIRQHWFRWWLGAVRQQDITWTNVDPDLCGHMASPGFNELSVNSSWGLLPGHVGCWWCCFCVFCLWDGVHIWG